MTFIVRTLYIDTSYLLCSVIDTAASLILARAALLSLVKAYWLSIMSVEKIRWPSQRAPNDSMLESNAQACWQLSSRANG